MQIRARSVTPGDDVSPEKPAAVVALISESCGSPRRFHTKARASVGSYSAEAKKLGKVASLTGEEPRARALQLNEYVGSVYAPRFEESGGR